MNKTQIQVLLLEDNLTDVIFLREALAEDALTTFDVTVVERLNSALELLEDRLFDIILLDLGLPDSQGLETFARLHQAVPYIPKVILSGLSDESVAMRSVHAGAQDYLVKGATGFASAARAIRYAIERSESQQELKANEERFRSLFTNMINGLAYCKMVYENDESVDFVYLDVNPVFEKLTGLKNVIGRRVSEIIPGLRETNPDVFEIYGRVAATGKSERFETFVPVMGEDGIWFSVSVFSPQREHFVAIFEVITERKRAEATIRGLARFPEEDPNPILRIGAAGQIIYANTASRAWLGAWNLSVGETLPTQWKELVAASFREDARQTHEVFVDKRIYSILIVPFRDAGYINIYGRDVTESRQATEKLREKAADEALINALNEAANRGESLERLIRLLGEKFKQMFSAKGTGLYLLSADGKSLNMPGLSLPEEVVGNLENLIGRHIPPLKVPIRAGSIFERFLQAPGGTILNDPEEIQQWITEFTGVETVPAGLEGVVSKLIPSFYHILGIHSTISLPLVASGKTIGLLGISSANILSQPDLERLRKISIQLSAAIQRKQHEQQLRASNERFEQLANHIEEAFWITTVESREEIYLSPAAVEIWGLPMHELKKPNAFLKHILPEDLPRMEGALLSQRQGEKTEIEYRILRPDGSIHWIWDRSFPIFDSDGKLSSNAGLATDITDIKESQSELEFLNRTLERRVQERTAEVLDLYDKAPCGYHSLDENGVFVNVNQTELEWLGYTRDELIGIKPFYDLLTPESRQLFVESFPRFKEQGWIRDLEFDVIRKDGGILPVVLNATASYDAAGNFLHSRSTMFDITERRKVEIALLRSRDDLSAANVALERAARLKDEFMANMSHELRTPLNAILGLSESLNEQVAGPLNEKQQKYIQTINESGHHLLQLINDILDLAKIEAGQIVLDLGRADLRMVCESSLVLVKQLAHRKNQQIEFEFDEDLKYIRADERSLKQMLVNLLSNAIKFSAEGEKLGLVAKLDKAEKKVLITVWDHGIGIAENDLGRLFRPFVQLSTGLARETSGTGLGLALVANMARLHGGSVGVESQPGQGSRFTVTLPWELVIETDTLSRLKITTKFRAINPNAPRQTILLVEDTEAVIMLLKDFLEAAGYNVEVARSGYDGMVLAEKTRPGLILMDVQMPGMDGLETTRRIRANPVIRDIPIIALTALAMPGDRERCLAAGMDEYISKPINLNSFTKTIHKLLHPEQ